MVAGAAPGPGVPAAIDQRTAEDIVDRAVGRWAEARRRRIDAFAAELYSLRGALRLHRHAVGLDLLRAPANIALALPQFALQAAGQGARALGSARGGRGKARARLRRAGAWLRRQDLMLRTDLAREIEWQTATRLLELPIAQRDRLVPRESAVDSLAQEILADPRVGPTLSASLQAIAELAQDPARRARLDEALATYTGSRTAAAEISSAMLSLGIGALALKQVTPGALSLGAATAAAITHHAAVASFPLGSSLGALWLALFPAAVPTALVVGVTGGIVLGATMVATLAGVIVDPAQRRLGLHQRRLRRLVDSLERQMRGDPDHRFAVRDHYVARLLDLFDLVRSLRMAG
ncbi:MAG: hypothetical protein JNK11_19485 [Alphaproteobacteria bacterium]|nr:hypothetical protein [Alphaproteobacteria bacterium]